MKVDRPGAVTGEATRVLGGFLRDLMKRNLEARNFRVFRPDETASNRLGALFEVTDKAFTGPFLDVDEHLSPDRRVLEVLSEHLCQGLLESYLLTSHVWRQDHSGFSHQDPGFIDHVVNKKAGIPTASPIATSTRSSRATSRSSSPTPAIPGSSIGSPTGAPTATTSA